jgi:hypothetical protein
MAEEQQAVFPPEEPTSPPDKARRLRITLQEKVDICIEVKRCVHAEKTISLKKYCRDHPLDIQPSQVRRWRAKVGEIKRCIDQTTKKKTRIAMSKGRPSRLEKIRDKLMPWVQAKMTNNKVVKVREVSVRAKRWDLTLRRMKRYTVFAIVHHWLDSNGIVTRAVTHKAQEDPRVMAQTATEFLLSTRPLLHQPNRSKAFTINMDQVPFKPHDSSKKPWP